MTATGLENLFNRSARGILRQVSEIVHVSAIYLGIAVLVTLVLSVTVPSLRAQASQMHTALIEALRPDGLQDGIMVGRSFQPGEAPDASASMAATSVPGTDASSANFTHSLAVTEHLSIPGVTSAQVQALRSYIARKYKIAHSVSGALIKAAFTVADEKNLDPQLLLAVIAVESRYNPFAESHVGAQGLMQVMTKVHKEKFELYGGGLAAALNPIANIRVGSQILQDCIKRRGSVPGGLACYVGAVGPGDSGYGAKVLAERRRIALASGIPLSH